MRQVSWKPGRAGVVFGVILSQIVFGAAFAQSADAPASAASPPAADAAKDVGPFGGCEPLGMTASGELVFPLECKHKIKPKASPVASEEQAPVAADKPVVAETKSAVTDDKPAIASEKTAVEDKPAADTKQVAVDDKTVAATSSVSETKPAATSETLTATDRAPPAAQQQPVEAAAAAAPANEKAVPATPDKATTDKAATGNASTDKSSTDKTATEKAASGKPAKQSARHAGKIASVSSRAVATAKPAEGSVVLAHAAAQIATASGPACTRFRSYNAATKSYLGFDGHKYACH